MPIVLSQDGGEMNANVAIFLSGLLLMAAIMLGLGLLRSGNDWGDDGISKAVGLLIQGRLNKLMDDEGKK
jgi:hypothetical protein